MVSVTDLCDVVADYLSGSMDRRAFARRLFVMMYGIEKNADAATVDLGYQLELSLGKAIGGLISEPELRFALAASVNTCTSVSVADEYKAEVLIPFDDSTALPYAPAGVVRV